MAKNIREKDDLTGQNISMLEPEYRIFTRSHFDPDGLEMIEFRAGSRSDGLTLYYTHEAPGKAILGFCFQFLHFDPLHDGDENH